MTSITLASITTNLLLLGIVEHPNVQRLPELLVVLVEEAQQPKGLSHPIPVSVFKYIDKNSFLHILAIRGKEYILTLLEKNSVDIYLSNGRGENILHLLLTTMNFT